MLSSKFSFGKEHGIINNSTKTLASQHFLVIAVVADGAGDRSQGLVMTDQHSNTKEQP
jgi:hypothetical protein